MKDTYTAAIKQSGDWWIGWIEEVMCRRGRGGAMGERVSVRSR